MKAKYYNQKGKEVGTVSVSERVFNAPWNPDLVHQVVISMQANAREGRPKAHAKGRSEVRGGGRKPWRQKGTGRARHGSRRSPIWIGGGVTHGPSKDKKYAKKINKKMRYTALWSTLSHKYADNEILFLDAVRITEPKTKEAQNIVAALAGIAGYEKLSTKAKNAALIALPENNEAVKKSFRNVDNVTVVETRNLNPVDLLSYTYVVIVDPEHSGALLEKGVEGTEETEATSAKVPKPKKASQTKKTASAGAKK